MSTPLRVLLFRPTHKPAVHAATSPETSHLISHLVYGDMMGALVMRGRLPVGRARFVQQDVQHEWLLRSVAIEPELRGRGICTYFLADALRQMYGTYGLRRCLLDVRPENTPAIRCYERLGFQFVNGAPVDGQRLARMSLYTLSTTRLESHQRM